MQGSQYQTRHNKEPSLVSASTLLERSVLAEKSANSQLVMHTDNGGPMKSITLRVKLEELGVASSYSRPEVSNDNPYLGSLFRTVKYHPRWSCEGLEHLGAGCLWVKGYVQWYNHEHRDSRIKCVTQRQRHSGEDVDLLKKRHALYRKMRHAIRHVGRTTRNWKHVPIVELNPKHHKEKKAA